MKQKEYKTKSNAIKRERLLEMLENTNKGKYAIIVDPNWEIKLDADDNEKLKVKIIDILQKELDDIK